MDEFEKVERLREKANVSYEEAREALKEANGDLLDAMVILEKQGKVKAPAQEQVTTSYEQKREYTDVVKTVASSEEASGTEPFGVKFKRFMKKCWRYLSVNFLSVTKKDKETGMEKEVFKMRLGGVVLIALAAWHVMIPVVIISLFFGIRYHFIGENNMDPANKVMNKAADVTDSIKDEFNKPE